MNFLGRLEHSSLVLNAHKSLFNKQHEAMQNRYFYLQDDLCLFYYRYSKLIKTRPKRQKNPFLKRIQDLIDRIRP